MSDPIEAAARASATDHFEAGGDETGCLALHLCTALADVMSIDPRDENYIDTRGLAGELIEALDAFRAASSPKRENETD